ncbi:MAG: tRNA-dihydrouridine synthase family protein [Ardenticatenaceae bacterium]|nr:tRNA-dihydrouridine synthase family protein [Ardenticatenaceae bacterium]
MQVSPSFRVGNVPIYGRTILSPMAGYSDVPYRAICRAYGSAMNYTEFVPVEALQGKPSRNRFWMRLDKQPGDQPMVFQIFGNDPQKILRAAVNIMPLRPDIIDINMGCSTKRVSGRGAGVGMMRNPSQIAETFELLAQELPIPVTGKIRLGWNDQQNFMEIGRVLEDSGAALIAIHGRTKEQKYTGRARWEAIALLKQAVSIPVIGNGDITEPHHIADMLDFTGCDAVMIGRGAIGNPWIFSGRSRDTLTFKELIDGIALHLREMIRYYGDPFGLIQFRKHFKRYIDGIPEFFPVTGSMIKTENSTEFFSYLETISSQVPAGMRIQESQPAAEMV